MRANDTNLNGNNDDLVDVDLYDDGSFPEFRFRQAPKGLATRRQLREMNLSPGGHEPVAQITWRNGKRKAWLYRIDLAKPKRKPTLAQEQALDRAMAIRQTCPECGRRYFHCLRLKTIGSCEECHDGTPAHPGSYTPPATSTQAA
ncbi:RRQRL motif-containing zinc-binding protein [Streptomyces sioyaensis]|uniref:RRQRL motif-containing zinc-binding protein n=1 Tax=Streptomyces sioyaensis TaxID=67364 RepID=UPI003D722956